MTSTIYHKLLRITALTLALVLLFISGFVAPITKELSKSAGSYLATAIGMQASVVPTDMNTLSAELEERSRELTQREIAVSLKEEQGSATATYVLSIILFILLVLIVLNYVLDFMRARTQAAIKTT